MFKEEIDDIDHTSSEASEWSISTLKKDSFSVLIDAIQSEGMIPDYDKIQEFFMENGITPTTYNSDFSIVMD